MSSEKPPVNTSTPEKNPLNNSEATHISAHSEERFDKVSSCMNKGAIESFSDMTERGKEIIGDSYEKLYDVPVVNRIVGKVGVAYKSFWLDRHEKKAAKEKGKMDGFGIAMSTLDQAGQDLSSVIDNLKQQNMPGSEALQLKLKVIEQQKIELQNKKDTVQTKFEAQSNKVKTFTNERDAIADKLIGRYEEKLAPFENAIDKLHHNKDSIEKEFVAVNLRHQEVLNSIEKTEEQKTKMEEGLRLTGMSDRAIRNFAAIKAIESVIASRRSDIRIENEHFTKRRNDIEKKIAVADKKANPYRDKRAEFVRAKQGRPIDMEVETRSSEKNEDRHEETLSHTRNEQSTESNVSEVNQEDNAEVIEESEKPKLITAYALRWNKYLNDKYGKDRSEAVLDMQSFFAEAELNTRDMTQGEDFIDLLDKYYKSKKVPAEAIEKTIEEDTKDFLQNYAPKE